ncbi:MAG: hypothetical protein E7254_09520 [Lachnospiraceae bacterium]|nr:hypothetical protein [Lachnospiraceae bacterium]
MSKIKLFLNRNKVDVIFMGALLMIVLAVLFIVNLNGNVFGERTDWVSQHAVIPEYFRQTFYNTGDLLPDFCMQLFGGINAYKLSYYGLLSPIILLSYLFPHVAMQDYILISTVIGIYVSVVLFLIWIKRLCKEMEYDTCFAPYVATCMFMFCAPLFFHSHMQIMFVNYMPFLVLGLMAVDRFVKKGKVLAVGISVAMLFLTSYYFAISATCCLSVYALFRVVNENRSDLKKIFQRAVVFSLTVIFGIMSTLVLLLPAFAGIMNGRLDGAGSFNAADNIFMPFFDVSSVCYSPYGLGLSAMVVIAMVHMIWTGSTAEKIISAIVLMLICCPIFKFVLNGFVYVRAKVLIPFVPLAILIFVAFISKRIKVNKIVISFAITLVCAFTTLFTERYIEIAIFVIAEIILIGGIGFTTILFNKRNGKEDYLPGKTLGIISVVLSVVIFVVVYFESSFLTLDQYNNYFVKGRKELAQIADAREKRINDNEENLYRSGDLNDVKYTLNQIHGEHYNTISGYSSVVNKYFLDVCYHDLRLNNPTVNPISVVSSEDVMFNMLMGVKYLYGDVKIENLPKDGTISKTNIKKTVVGYEEVEETLLCNNDVGGIAFADSDAVPKNKYDNLSAKNKEVALLDYIVFEDDDYSRLFGKKEKYVLEYFDKVDKFSIGTKTDNSYYHIDSTAGDYTTEIEIPDLNKNDIVSVTCHIRRYTEKRATIIINGIKNSLSGKENSFPNDNFDFKYVFTAKENGKLKIKVPVGCNFDVTAMNVYKLNYSKIKDILKDRVYWYNSSFTGNNTISGEIDLEKRMPFMLTVPYDEGFKMFVDGKEQDILLTDNGFMGCVLDAGHHKIEFKFTPQFSREGRVLSIVGIALLLLLSLVCSKMNREMCEENS